MPANPARTFRPTLTALDDRCLPAIGFTASLAPGGVLTVTGTTGNDLIVVTRQGRDLTVAGSGPLRTFPDSAVKRVEVNALGGNDAVLVVDDRAVGPKPVRINGGAGNDFLVGGRGNDVIVGGAGDDYLFGMGGNDVLRGGDGGDVLQGGGGIDAVFGEGGQDTFLGLAANEPNDRLPPLPGLPNPLKEDPPRRDGEAAADAGSVAGAFASYSRNGQTLGARNSADVWAVLAAHAGLFGGPRSDDPFSTGNPPPGKTPG